MPKEAEGKATGRSRRGRPAVADDRGDAFFRLLLENSLCATSVVEKDGTVLWQSQPIQSMLGYPPGARLGRSGIELVHPEDLPAAAEALAKMAREEGASASQLVRLRHADGSWRTFDVMGRNLLHVPEVRGIVASFRDITELRQREQALWESEMKYWALVQQAGDGVVVVQDEVLRFANRAVAEITGYAQDELIGMHFLDALAPGQEDAIAARYQSYFGGQLPDTIVEMTVVRKDGETRDLEAKGTIIQYEGRPAVLGIVRDVTDRRRAQAALQESEEWHRALVETAGRAGLGITITQDTDGTEAAIVYANEEYCRISGYPREELLGMSALETVSPDDRETIRKRYRRRQRGWKAPGSYEARLLRKDGTPLHVEVSVSTMSYRGRVATVSFFRDVVARRKAEEELARYRQRLEELVEERTAELTRMNELLQLEVAERTRAEEAAEASVTEFSNVLENSVDMIYRLNLQTGYYDYASPSSQRVLGYTPEEFISLEIGETGSLVHPEDWEDLVANVSQILLGTGDPATVRTAEYRIKHKELGYRWVSDSRSLVRDEEGMPLAVVGDLRDITERKQAEEKLAKLYQEELALRRQVEEEMQRRVEFTRALAHELKTPLTSILASNDLLISEAGEEPLMSIARNIGRGAANLQRRIDELIDAAKGDVGLLELKTQSVDLTQLLRSAADAMTPVAAARGQSVLVELPSSIGRAEADPVRIQQVVTNLLSNAVKFTPRGGKITLRARQGRGAVIVEVQDTGRGMSKDEQARLFDLNRRVESHEERSGGLGLGLSLSRTLVKLHGGDIWVKSRPGRGSTFGFSIPVRAGERPAPEREEAAKLVKVVMVEEDLNVVDSVSLGFKIHWPEARLISTTTAGEGLELVAIEDPDVVVLDLVLPDMGGFEALRRIRQFSPVPVVVLTASADEADIMKALEWGADDCVMKPFGQRELLDRLRLHLRRRRSADAEAPIEFGSIRFDPSRLQLIYGDRQLTVTAIEARILQHLIRNAGYVVPHRRLAEAVWGEQHPAALESLRVYIHHLRQKLEADPGHPRIIVSKRGAGYMLVKPE